MRLIAIVAALSLASTSASALAQFPGGVGAAGNLGGVGGAALPVFGATIGGGFGGGWGGGWGGGFSSTIQEGYQRGMADVIRSAGAANLMDSVASQNYEVARSMYLDNVLKSTETFFENRKMAKSYRDAERGPPISREALYRMAKDAAPKRLSAGEFDPVTGDLSFPLVLQDPAFTDSCQRLRELFRTRNASGGGIGLKARQEIDVTVRQLQDDLRARQLDFPANSYLQAQNFLKSLTHEASFAAGYDS